MTEKDWTAVDAYIIEKLSPPDAALDGALKRNRDAGLPSIDVSPAQGKLLHLLARLAGARRILEIGTLGGYSTIWLARALPDDGKIVTLEYSPAHAAVARENIQAAGQGAKLDLRVGPALESLPLLEKEGAVFDFVFIDADKRNNPDYLQWALRLARVGAAIVVDNVVREGRVLDAASDDLDIVGTRKFFDQAGAEKKLTATAIQTVGAKGWDGFAIGLVEKA
ncbi:O-methyltransferase [Rhodoblastus acidophilus]|uniref:O-methyltransferase n=1 Tax=Candidatus Rhodoblastus alkanivorans TaxID=2954117 RepID=A0ABS9Z4I5_9HYPH|nr:O-methyltransferase [Candidatus Rhodoblastus alkanivorans]MCI4677720.1 O-methyltransferase [Candidatus Rhodoblastus alkanivorans]MCI4682548.1 O-methyltransferase [Candidatus Rhodoblastus alkanivorans]MDI4639854.1 O-methyltransferase [Rhodoblastus acidophilus]